MDFVILVKIQIPGILVKNVKHYRIWKVDPLDEHFPAFLLLEFGRNLAVLSTEVRVVELCWAN